MDHTSPVFLHCFGKPGRGITISRPKLENGLGVNHARQLITVIATYGADNGKVILLRDFLHFLHLRFTRRNERSKIILHRLIINFAHSFSYFELIRISLITGIVFSAHKAYIFPEGCKSSGAVNAVSLTTAREMEVTST